VKLATTASNLLPAASHGQTEGTRENDASHKENTFVMADPTIELRDELNALLRLSNVETTVLQARIGQAANDTVRREIESRADKSQTRARQLAQEVRELGGLPDQVGASALRFGATVKVVLDQGGTLGEALLDDLNLERQLQDRTRFAKVLAEAADERRVVRLLERFDAAFEEHIDWINNRLAQVALGGPVDIRPTPAQLLFGATRRVAELPRRQFVQQVNRSVEAIDDLRQRVGETLDSNVGRLRELASAAEEIWSAGRNASLKRAEQVARQEGDRRTARSVHRARAELGALEADELPIRGYDRLPVQTAVTRLERLTDAKDVRAVLAYEEANKNRKRVITTAQRRIAELADELANA
jgi:bacterioferritin (cytochrome b1)